MSDVIEISVAASSPPPFRSGQRRVPVQSVAASIEIVGAAIVRHVKGEIGIVKARDIAKAGRSAKIHGAFFQSVVYANDFSEHGIRKIFHFAEVIGLDPTFEVAVAYAEPEVYFQTCRRYSIVVPDHVRARLKRAKPLRRVA